LHHAASIGNNELVKLLIAHKANKDVQESLFGHTSLMTAISNKKFEAARYLIESGADLHVVDNAGFLALHTAAKIGDCDLILMLAAGHADASLKNRYGQAPLHLLCSNFKRQEADSVLTKCFDALLSTGADIDAKDNEGSTPLMYAVKRDNPFVARLLLKNKANVSVVNYYGETALHLACSCGPGESVELLLRHGADLKAQDKKGKIAQDYDKRKILASIYKTAQKVPVQSKKIKKKKTKSGPTFAQRQERKQEQAVAIEPQKSMELESKKPIEAVVAHPKKLILASRVTRWFDQAFLDAKELECRKNPRKGYWHFMCTKLYHQLPMAVLRTVIMHGEREIWHSKKYHGKTEQGWFLEGEMVFADPASNPWKPGKSTQRGFYHCTCGADGQIYHVGFDAIYEDSSRRLADFMPDELQSNDADKSKIVIQDDQHNSKHVLYAMGEY